MIDTNNLDRSFIDTFIRKVFNYYNGKINIFNNNCILKIDWAYRGTSSCVGFSRNPNIVIIFPMVMIRYSNSANHLLTIIVETIIHELYHCDQIIDYSRMNNDKEYILSIEHPAEIQTLIYVINHTNEIAEQFGLYLNTDPEEYKLYITMHENGYFYYRRRYVDHIFIMLSEISRTSFAEMYYAISSINDMLVNNHGTIVISFNNNKYLIQDNDYKIPLQKLNEIFYNEFFQYPYIINTHIEYKYDDKNDIGLMEINYTGTNVMVKKINGGSTNE